jgi:hypothetical protein
MRARRLRADARSASRLARRLLRERDRVAPLVPDIDPGDLLMILNARLRPFGHGRRLFLRQIRPGVYVP